MTARFPEVRTLYTSGYTEDRVVRRDMVQEGNSFLATPFSAADLSNAMQRTLTRRYSWVEESASSLVAQPTA